MNKVFSKDQQALDHAAMELTRAAARSLAAARATTTHPESATGLFLSGALTRQPSVSAAAAAGGSYGGALSRQPSVRAALNHDRHETAAVSPTTASPGKTGVTAGTDETEAPLARRSKPWEVGAPLMGRGTGYADKLLGMFQALTTEYKHDALLQ